MDFHHYQVRYENTIEKLHTVRWFKDHGVVE
jgi:hypothetical protein